MVNPPRWDPPSTKAQHGICRVVLTLQENLPAGNYQLIVAGLANALGNTMDVEQNSTEGGFPGPLSGMINVLKPAVHLLNSFTIAPDSANVMDADFHVTAAFAVTSTQGEFTPGNLSFAHPTAKGTFPVFITNENMAGLPSGSITGTGSDRCFVLQFWIPEDILGVDSLYLTYTGQFGSNGTRWTLVLRTRFVMDAGTSLSTSTGRRRPCTVTDPSPYSPFGQPRLGRIRVVQNPNP